MEIEQAAGEAAGLSVETPKISISSRALSPRKHMNGRTVSKFQKVAEAMLTIDLRYGF